MVVARWSPQGDRLAAAGADGTILVWDATTGREIHALKGHTTTVRSVHWSPDGRRLVSGSDDRTVRVWDSKTGRELLVWESNLKTAVGTTDYARL